MTISVVACDCADGLNHSGQFFADVFTKKKKNPVAAITTINHVDYA